MGTILNQYRALGKDLDAIVAKIEEVSVKLYGAKETRQKDVFIIPPSPQRDALFEELQTLLEKRRDCKKKRKWIQEQAERERKEEKRLNLAKKRANRKKPEPSAFVKRFNSPAKHKASQPKKDKIKSESIETKNSIRTLSAGTGNW
jgi:hypothetical protein